MSVNNYKKWLDFNILYTKIYVHLTAQKSRATKNPNTSDWS